MDHNVPIALVIICLFAISSPLYPPYVIISDTRFGVIFSLLAFLFSKVTMTSWRVINNSP